MRNSLLRYCLSMLFVSFANFAVAVIDFGSVVKGDEPILHIERYGRGSSLIVSNGYLFVDSQYIPAPYVVERIGQAVVVNGIIVNCLYKGELPDKFERPVTKIMGKDNKKFIWTSPPHPASNLKETADSYAGILADWLRSRAVILSKTRFMVLQPKPISEVGMEKRLPMIGKTSCAGFPKMLEAVLAAQTDEQILKAVKEGDRFWRLGDEDTLNLMKNARESKALKDRIRVEIELADAKKGHTEPLYATPSPDLAVVNVTAYQWKLTILFDNGLEFYVGRDMEIRDILFTTNAITVEAYRDDIRFPLPETKRIRVAPKLQATIKSCNTGQTCTATITDAISKAICLDDVKYQVIDIRADAKTVLIKNLKTGERLLVVSDKDLTKADSP